MDNGACGLSVMTVADPCTQGTLTNRLGKYGVNYGARSTPEKCPPTIEQVRYIWALNYLPSACQMHTIFRVEEPLSTETRGQLPLGPQLAVYLASN